MKNVFNLGLLALVITLSAACSSEKKADDIDTTLADSVTIAPESKTADSTTTIDTLKTDSTQKDSVIKKTTTKIEIKH